MVSSHLPRFWHTLEKQPKRGDKWRLDEVCLNMNGQKYWLWRAVDQEGYELDILVQKRRNKRAAKRFFKKLLKGLKYEPRVLITDKLKSYAAAKKEVMPKVEHRQHKYLNNRAENSHQPTRNKEKQMRKFKSPQRAQRLLYPMGQIHNLFKTHRHKVNANQFRIQFLKAKKEWQNITLPLSMSQGSVEHAEAKSPRIAAKRREVKRRFVELVQQIPRQTAAANQIPVATARRILAGCLNSF